MASHNVQSHASHLGSDQPRQRLSILKHEKLTDLGDRPEPLNPTLSTAGVEISPQTREGQHHQLSTNRESLSAYHHGHEDNSDRSLSITELVPYGATALAHFGTRKCLFRSASAPTLLSASYSSPSPSSHLPARKDHSTFLAEYSPRPSFPPFKRTTYTEGLTQPQQLRLTRPKPDSGHSGRLSHAGPEDQSQNWPSQRRTPGLECKNAVSHLGKSAPSALRARSRSPPFDLTLPTEHELRIAAHYSSPPPIIPRRSACRPNPYHLVAQTTPVNVFVRRGAVSYRKDRPLIQSRLKSNPDQVIETAAARTFYRATPSPRRQQASISKSTWSFCKEEFSSSPLTTQLTPPDWPQNLEALPGRTPITSRQSSATNSSISPAIAEAYYEIGPQSYSRGATSASLQSSTAVDKDVIPKVELPPFTRLSLGGTRTHHQEPPFSEVAKGKRPESRELTQSFKAMDSLHPESAMGMTEHRREAIRMAKGQEAAVIEKCKRSGVAAPGYTFNELIGKGSFGRVYKGIQTSSKKVVAIKVIDIDDADFRASGDHKDEQINDFNKEIRILRQAQESGAPNLNQIIEALPVHSQLWLVCEHCPGGSVKTLMRATNDKLAERYITVVARELGKALKGLHDAGIMHRDVKAANVLIHEEGRLELCDFGVATVLDKKSDKRRTFIGTFHWMPPELWDKDPEYSDEVDVWAFGCTLYECAVGKPPNADLREPQQLRSRMRRLNQSIELPGDGNYSSGLRSLVSCALTPDAATRPSFSDVLRHEYLANTEESHPTTILSELVKVYYSWLYSGGQRASLFMPGGAVAGDTPGSLVSSDEDWNFSATASFENRMSTILNIPDFSDLSDMQYPGGESTPKANIPAATGELSAEEKANFDERVRRGADLFNIFDRNKPNYEYVTKTDFVPIQERRVSDLPLRAMSEERPYSIANQVIDLGDFDSSNYASVTQARDEKIKLADAATIKANRGNSKLYLDLSACETLTAKPSLSTNEGSSIADRGLRPPTQDFSFPPKEWQKQDNSVDEAETGELPKARDPAKHKTMEWSFANAMSEAHSEDARTSPNPEEAETKSKPKKHDTMLWSFESAMAEASVSSSTAEQPRRLEEQQPQQQQQEQQEQQQQRTSRRAPPLGRSVTAPIGSDLLRSSISNSEPDSTSINDEGDPFALDDADNEYPALASAAVQHALDERGISSFYARARGEGFLRRMVGDGEGGGPEGREDGEDDEDEEDDRPATVTMPAIHRVDDRALDAQADPTTLQAELDRLLAEFRGVLGGAEEAVAAVERREKKRRGRGRGRKGEGEDEGDSDWEDEEEY